MYILLTYFGQLSAFLKAIPCHIRNNTGQYGLCLTDVLPPNGLGNYVLSFFKEKNGNQPQMSNDTLLDQNKDNLSKNQCLTIKI